MGEDKRYPNVIGRLVFLNVSVLLVFVALTTYQVVPVYPSRIAIFPILFVSNFFIIWRAHRTGKLPKSSPDRLNSAYKKLRRGAIVWSAAGLIGLIVIITQRDSDFLLRAAIGALMLAALWFLVYRLGKISKTQKNQPHP